MVFSAGVQAEHRYSALALLATVELSVCLRESKGNRLAIRVFDVRSIMRIERVAGNAGSRLLAAFGQASRRARGGFCLLQGSDPGSKRCMCILALPSVACFHRGYLRGSFHARELAGS